MSSYDTDKNNLTSHKLVYIFRVQNTHSLDAQINYKYDVPEMFFPFNTVRQY